MKLARLCLIVAVFGAVFSACVSSADSERSAVAAMCATEWWRSERMADSAGIYAVGSSSIANVAAASEFARLSGRGGLARMVSSAMSELGCPSDGATLLEGSRQVDFYKEEDGATKVLVFLPYDSLAASLRSVTGKTVAKARLRDALERIAGAR